MARLRATLGTHSLPAAGKILVSLPHDQSHGYGFVLPGSRVDVLVSFPKEGKWTVRPMLENVRVLAVDVSRTQNVGNYSTVYFGVDPKEAQLLREARRQNWELAFLLRGPGE